MKKILFILALALTPLFAVSQYANSWINYSQPYYQFKVSQNGIYKIDYNTLVNSGIPVTTIDPRNIQVFGRGQEIAIYFEGESDGTIDSLDFIEFYGEKNDHWLDSNLYGGYNKMPNHVYSQYNDTATYYLTWNISTSNKRMVVETDTAFSSYTPSIFFWKKLGWTLNNVFYPGNVNGVGGTDSDFDEVETWGSGKYGKGQQLNFPLQVLDIEPSINTSEFQSVVLGASNYLTNNPDHHLRVVCNTNTIADTLFEGYKRIFIKETISTSFLSSTNNMYFQSINDIAPGDPNFVDWQGVSYYTLTYPHKPTFFNPVSQYDFEVDDHISQAKSLFNISNFTAAGNASLYDITNNRKIPVIHTGGNNYSFIIPNSGGRKKCFATAETAKINITSLQPINQTGFFTDYSLLNIDSAYLIISHTSLMNEANNFAQYRNLTGYNTYLTDIEELYHQFAYGVRKHPLAIKNYCDYLINTLPSPPQYLFLIGKSVKLNLHRKNGTAYNLNLIPTYGHPGSDILLTAGLNGTLLEPAIKTGRLSATTPQEVTDYLSKVIDYENAPQDEWMKNILHFAGGTNISESNLFSFYLDQYKLILQDTSFGANVTTFKKTSTAPIQTTLSDSIKNMINRGVSMMNFFGHASTTGGFDQNIDDPSLWNNYQKYPLVYANACFAGDIHLDNKLSTSEKYINIADEGAIAFIASVALGIPAYLHSYSSEFVTNLGQSNYGKTIGSHIQNTIKAIQGAGNNDYVRSVCFEMTLHGDPALVINAPDLPDYEITTNNIYFNPSNVTTVSDSFDVNVVVLNKGKAVNTPIIIELTRDFPVQGVNDTIYTKVISGTKYKDTITFTLPVDPIRGIGLNYFSAYVDALNNVQESNENNNFITVPLLIKSGDIVPVVPYEYAIIPNQGQELVASTGLPFATNENYVFQLDTTDLFNSPLFQTTTITNKNGAVVKWKPSLLQNMPDSMVYFWRVSKDSTSTQGYNWKESSFQYIPGKRGWGQAHHFQFKKDDFQYIKYDKPGRKFSFVNDVKQLFCKTYGDPLITGPLSDILYRIDSETRAYNGIGWAPAIHLAVLDSSTLESWNSNNLNMGQDNLTGNKRAIFIFRTQNPTQLQAMENMLNDSIPDGHYVLAYTWRYGYFNQWNPSTINAFTSLGASSISTIGDSIPYIFFAKVGTPSSATEVVGTNNKDIISLTKSLSLNATYGNILSEILGPATQWDSIWWRFNSTENPSADSTDLSVYGIDLQGTETLVIPSIPSDSLDINITNKISATSYPFLKFNLHTKDDSIKTPSQLKRWQAIYSGVPECALNPEIAFSFYNDTVAEGEDLSLKIAIENIGDYNMDSLLIAYSIITPNYSVIPLPYPRQGKLLVDSVMTSELTFSSKGLDGNYQLFIEVNPNNDQLEQFHFNNIGTLNFHVNGDDLNPILDVTFDGVHILDGELVSSKPNILITLDDENKYLPLDDTADFEIYLKDPAGNQKRIYFKDGNGNDIMKFYPASLPNNSAKVEYNPHLKVDGTYELIVQAQDKSDNLSGDYDYTISFEVINKSTITNVMSYPNPFSTCAHFVFTLTGSEAPDNIQIQILTVTGKLVRTIELTHFEQIRIGKNITDYCWDGKDDFGDQLANGLYLYKVNTRLNGQVIEHRETNADQYFHRGFGKMYLIK